MWVVSVTLAVVEAYDNAALLPKFLRCSVSHSFGQFAGFRGIVTVSDRRRLRRLSAVVTMTDVEIVEEKVHCNPKWPA
ncbi:unnamed protein product [Toxocara canis]|uniref:Secreted protein n=1 Tax=Toxocara canis TaxID=6265 RepID=A0A183VD68_TOXCA|nr:unnamed protein product [Toxocara canis]